MQLASNTTFVDASGAAYGVKTPVHNGFNPYSMELPHAQKLDQSEWSTLFQGKHDKFSAAETVSLCCRHCREAVEVFDDRIRLKRLKELSRELSAAVSYKILYQRRQDLWDALKKIVEPLIDAEGKTAEGEGTRNEQVYASTARLVVQLREVNVTKDYFYESMLMDIQALEKALWHVYQSIIKERQRQELLRVLSSAHSSPQIQGALEHADLIQQSVEAKVATRMIALFKEIDEANAAREAAEGRNRNAKSSNKDLEQRIRELEADVASKQREIDDLMRRLQETKRSEKKANDNAAREEEKYQKEQQNARQLSNDLDSLREDNKRLRREIEILNEKLAKGLDQWDEINRLRAELEEQKLIVQSEQRQRMDLEAELEKERTLRKQADRHMMEIRSELKICRNEKITLLEKVKEMEAAKEAILKDLERERSWRNEWKDVHNQVKDAVQRLYQADAPGVIDERSHQVMAMLQERIASENHARGKVEELEDKLHREASNRMLYERRLAGMQAQMLDMRVKAARGEMPLESEMNPGDPVRPLSTEGPMLGEAKGRGGGGGRGGFAGGGGGGFAGGGGGGYAGGGRSEISPARASLEGIAGFGDRNGADYRTGRDDYNPGYRGRDDSSSPMRQGRASPAFKRVDSISQDWEGMSGVDPNRRHVGKAVFRDANKHADLGSKYGPSKIPKPAARNQAAIDAGSTMLRG